MKKSAAIDLCFRLGLLLKNLCTAGSLEFIKRLTPVYAFVIFYYATVFNHTGYGPLWKVIAGGDSKDCRTNWWTNLLYISNYVNTDHMPLPGRSIIVLICFLDTPKVKVDKVNHLKILYNIQAGSKKQRNEYMPCMTHTWYLPCDFHYFIIATFLCLFMKKEKKIGLGIISVLTFLSMVVPFALTVIYQRPALLYFYPDFLTGPKIHPDFMLTYSKTHTRATPYCIGMFAGYLYYKLKGSEKHIRRTKSSVIIIVSLCLLFVSVFTGKVFYNPYHEYNAIESASYAALHRLAWALGSVGLLYATSFGHASFVKKILTWSPWIPLSKLVYGAYLVHMQFQLRSAARFMNPRQITYFDVISLSLSDMVLSFITALCLFLMIEAPFRKIFRELMMPARESPPKAVAGQSTVGQNMINNVNNNNNNYQDSRL